MFFKIVEGGIAAIVVPSCSGKSTLAKLLVSFLEADRGRILLGGVDVRKHPLSQVMQSVAYVSQDNFLFNASLRENIRLGRPDATDREVKEAAEAAACGFIKALPGGYDTPAGDAGARLSGGERQRAAIAVALYHDPDIILADEPTASLDEANAGQVSLLLSGYARTLGSTLLVVSHDDAVLADMDRVLDLNRGNVREAA
mgnify:CR=1 FL=1